MNPPATAIRLMVAGSGTSAPRTANAAIVLLITAGAGLSTSTIPVIGGELKYQLELCVVAAGVGASISSQYGVPATSEAFMVEDALSS